MPPLLYKQSAHKLGIILLFYDFKKIYDHNK